MHQFWSTNRTVQGEEHKVRCQSSQPIVTRVTQSCLSLNHPRQSRRKQTPGYISPLQAQGHSVEDAAVEGAILRLRPIRITMLAATLGLFPAALPWSLLSDCRRSFFQVIVGGLLAALSMQASCADGNKQIPGRTTTDAEWE